MRGHGEPADKGSARRRLEKSEAAFDARPSLRRRVVEKLSDDSLSPLSDALWTLRLGSDFAKLRRGGPLEAAFLGKLPRVWEGGAWRVQGAGMRGVLCMFSGILMTEVLMPARAAFGGRYGLMRLVWYFLWFGRFGERCGFSCDDMWY